jgi:hypothetical protein
LANEANKKMSRGGKKITWSNIRDTFNYDSNVLKIRYTKLSNEAVNGLDHFRKMNTNYATVVFQKKTIEVMKQVFEDDSNQTQWFLSVGCRYKKVCNTKHFSLQYAERICEEVSEEMFEWEREVFNIDRKKKRHSIYFIERKIMTDLIASMKGMILIQFLKVKNFMFKSVNAINQNNVELFLSKQKGMCGFRNNITASMYSQNFRILLTYHNLIQQNKISYNQDDSLVIFNDLLKPKRMITNRSLYSSSFFKNTTFEVQDKRNSLQKLE